MRQRADEVVLLAEEVSRRSAAEAGGFADVGKRQTIDAAIGDDARRCLQQPSLRLVAPTGIRPGGRLLFARRGWSGYLLAHLGIKSRAGSRCSMGSTGGPPIPGPTAARGSISFVLALPNRQILARRPGSL